MRFSNASMGLGGRSLALPRILSEGEVSSSAGVPACAPYLERREADEREGCSNAGVPACTPHPERRR